MTAPQLRLYYAEDVTVDDVTGLYEYLRARVAAVRAEYGPGSTAAAAVLGVADGATQARATLQSLIERTGPGMIAVHRLYEIKWWWNQLVALASGWHGHDDYETLRWVQVTYVDAAAEDEFRTVLDDFYIGREQREREARQ